MFKFFKNEVVGVNLMYLKILFVLMICFLFFMDIFIFFKLLFLINFLVFVLKIKLMFLVFISKFWVFLFVVKCGRFCIIVIWFVILDKNSVFFIVEFLFLIIIIFLFLYNGLL